MTQQPKVGDRVRLITTDYEPNYTAGDTGIVEVGPVTLPSGQLLYSVRMDKDGPRARGFPFSASKIELDAPRDGS
jgi:hypothetical protein